MTPLEETQQALGELIAHVTGTFGLQRMSLDVKLQQACLSAWHVLQRHSNPTPTPTMESSSRVQAQPTYVITLTHAEAQALLGRLCRSDLAGSFLLPIYDDLSRAVYPTAGAQSTGLHVDPDA